MRLFYVQGLDAGPNFCRGIEKPSWVNTDIDLGSDHYIVVVSFEVVCKKLREFKLIDWDKFRKLRANPDASPDEADPPLESWIEQLGLDIHASERTILTDVGTEKMDHRLANLLEAKQSILARWKGQRLNTRLRKKIALLNREIEEYCKILCKQQWDEICNSLDGQLRKGRGWGLLRHLLDEGGSRSKPTQRSLLSKIIHKARKEAKDDELLEDLAGQYLHL